eukprot:1943909-Prymnesium_polylepis.1
MDARLQGLVGEGSFGTVHRCTVHGHVFALKRCPKAKRAEYTLVCLRRELEVHQLLRSDFVVPLVAAWEDDSVYSMLLELQACDLFDLVSAHDGTLSELATKFVAACVAVGMAHLHSHRVLYRDLKPENVLIAADGYARLGDMGYACRLAPDGRARSFCGTEEYSPPELFRSGRVLSSDWWSVGVLLHELCAPADRTAPAERPARRACHR